MIKANLELARCYEQGRAMFALEVLESYEWEEGSTSRMALAVIREYVEASTPVDSDNALDDCPKWAKNIPPWCQVGKYVLITDGLGVGEIRMIKSISLQWSGVWIEFQAVDGRHLCVNGWEKLEPVTPNDGGQALAKEQHAAKVWTREELKEQFALGECANVIEALEMAEALMGRGALCELIGCDGRMLGRALNGHPANNKIADYIKPLLPKMEEGDKDEL